ncbi:NACHT domain-containing protein [Roseivirga ehrenbergii]|uniref:NACHT domain-containing protein n=1 Tax=Roseivirga ehrenbergii (strain DSM 102268 / JCM 13514 / KCTC 12282 / NCIMB 14502 / KMM 6017) TaxID=279360 RepID=A0A150X083_ROSEK|nr:NACHT domain-containing protein [Roseivirga ehrenbergii]KYG72133.1 hypothetical protein MB14_08775 [Roseivirga ehrenbergii]TCL13364.1 NACHT domain-containing protein [Roseivirga ehrenbergii]
MNELVPILGKELIKPIIDNFSKNFLPWIKQEKRSIFKNTVRCLPEKLEVHCIDIVNWSNKIPLMGFSNPRDTELFSTELEISSNINTRNTVISEEEFLNERTNSIIIGSPGSGKTTTIKRLIQKFFTNHDSNFAIPILVRLRSLKFESISEEVLDIFGIQPKYVKLEGSKPDIIKAFIGEEPIEVFLPKFLNYNKVLLFLDGLDEVRTEIQGEIFNEIESLGLKLNQARIVVSVRKSHFTKRANHFEYYHIRSLSKDRIIKISKKWLPRTYKAFLKELELKPYTDLANRPIFLTILLILYDKENSLPEEPNEVYEEMTFLVIRDWDEQRGIKRKSKYSGFGTRAKLRFLSEVAFALMYKLKSKSFNSKEIGNIYEKLHKKYSLPIEELHDVVSEIESHNGIIIELGYNKYEFSHLSIQEYLCARHILTLPFSKEVINYFHEYPEPLAIAICLSQAPNEWFANLIRNRNLVNRSKSSIRRLLERLLVEVPTFDKDHELGYTIVQIMFDTHGDEEAKYLILDFLKLLNTKESLVLVLRDYQFIQVVNNACTLSRLSHEASNLFVTHPAYGDIHLDYIKLLDSEGLIDITKIDKIPT